MKLQEITNQLKAVLPKHTGDFTTNLSISSLARSGSVVTATTNDTHGLILNDKVLIRGAKTPITIDSLTRHSTYALAITNTEHNLTKANVTTEISGADQSDYNGTKTLLWTTPLIEIESITISGTTATVTTKTAHGFVDNANVNVRITGINQYGYNKETTLNSVPTSTTFTYTVYGVDTNATPAPNQLMQAQLLLNSRAFMFEVVNTATTPATGSILQLSEYLSGYNGYKTVSSVIDANNFTYSIESEPDSPALGTIVARTYPNIAPIITYDRAARYFESLNNSGRSGKWIFVELEDEVANKSSFTTSDNLSNADSTTYLRQKEFQNLNLYVFIPCGNSNDELLYGLTRDLAAGYKPHIYKALFGFKPSSDLTENFSSSLVPVNNGSHAFTGSYYVHIYTFQAYNYAIQEDAIEVGDLSAFRTFDFDILDNEGFETSVMEIKGDFDESS